MKACFIAGKSMDKPITECALTFLGHFDLKKKLLLSVICQSNMYDHVRRICQWLRDNVIE